MQNETGTTRSTVLVESLSLHKFNAYFLTTLLLSLYVKADPLCLLGRPYLFEILAPFDGRIPSGNIQTSLTNEYDKNEVQNSTDYFSDFTSLGHRQKYNVSQFILFLGIKG